jgi:opacity protein-like surface antigen
MLKPLYLTLSALLLTSGSLVAQDAYGLYVGGAYASTNLELSIEGLNEAKQQVFDNDTNSVILFAGYNINKNIGIEGRYYVNSSDITLDDNSAFSGTYKAQTIALYAKPKLDLGVFALYGLIGFSYNDYTLDELFDGGHDDTLFSWGAGTQFNLTHNLGFFVDYTDLGRSENVITTNLSSWNLGINYQF